MYFRLWLIYDISYDCDYLLGKIGRLPAAKFTFFSNTNYKNIYNKTRLLFFIMTLLK